ncbi:DUF637 domain-containing protein [Pseudoalteromonas luteoviolacea]|nr:DUF637 domain-containing protein [Pseudoalteromonas luteoviolacea]
MNTSMETIKRSSWHKVTSYALTFFMMLQLTLPSIAAAQTSAVNAQINQELTTEQLFARSVISAYLYERSKYIAKPPSEYTNQTIEEFHTRLKDGYTHRLPGEIATDWIPVSGEITVFVPKERVIYPLHKQVGDDFVQRKLIGNQIKRLLGRTYYKNAFRSEQQQINQLYANALKAAIQPNFSYVFGDTLPEGIADTLKLDFIWPETRNIGGEYVLVPVVHLQSSVVDSQSIDGSHTVEFISSNASFKSANITNTDLKLQRDTVFSTIHDLVIGDKASITIDNSDVSIYAGVSYIDDGMGGVKGVATGTLYNYGQINSARNVNIVAGNYEQKTLVHRFKNAHGYRDYLGNVTSINAKQGISIKTFDDLNLIGAKLSAGGSITLDAQGNINIGSVPLSYSSAFKVGQYDTKEEGISYFQSVLTAGDSIKLLAEGKLSISGAQLLADSGMLELIAGNGVSIVNDVDRDSYYANDSYGSSTDEINELTEIAVTAALDAGKGVIIRTTLGDIELQGVDISSQDGAKITAEEGKVKLLLARDNYKYYRHSKKENLFRIKTRTEQEQRERPIYNTITGGVEINASQGIELALAKIDGQPDPTLAELKQEFSKHTGLAWMTQLAENSSLRCPPVPDLSLDFGYLSDGSYNLHKELQLKHKECVDASSVDIVFEALKDYHNVDTTRSLSPAAMAIIAIAVSFAMGPGGFELVGSANATLSATTVGKAITAAVGQQAFSAGVIAISTQAATSLASGRGLDGTVKDLLSSDTIKNVATSMVTAGLADKYLPGVSEAITKTFGIPAMLTDAILHTTMSASVRTAINGGSFSDLDEQIISGLKSYAAQQLGQAIVSKIDDTWKVFSDSNTEVAMNYVAHAFSGCLIGVLNHQTNTPQNDEAEKSCVINAGASVVGRYIGVTKAKAEGSLADFKEFSGKYKDDVLREIDASGLDPALMADIYNDVARGPAQGFLNKHSTDELTRLYTALTVFLAGGSADVINMASNTASDQVKAVINYKFSEYLIREVQLVMTARKFGSRLEDKYGTGLSVNDRSLESLKRLASKENNGSEGFVDAVHAEDMKAEIIQSLKDENFTDEQIAEIDQIVDFDEISQAIETATHRLSTLGGQFECPVEIRCTKYMMRAFGIQNKFDEASVFDRRAIGQNLQGDVTETQRLVAQVTEILQPIGQPIDELATGVVAKYGDEIEQAKGVIIAIDILKAPVLSVINLIYQKTPLAQRINQSIADAHTQAVAYAAKGSDTLTPDDVSRTYSGLLIAKDIAVSVAAVPKTVRELNLSKAMFQNEGMVVLKETPRPCGAGRSSASQYQAYGDSDLYSEASTYSNEIDPYQVTGYSAYTPMSSNCTAKLTNVETPAGTFVRFDKENKEASWEEFLKLNPNTRLTQGDFYDYAFTQEKVFNTDTKLFNAVIDGKPAIKSKPIESKTFAAHGLNVNDKSATDRDGTTYTYQEVNDAKVRIESRKEELQAQYPGTYRDLPEYKSLISEGGKYSERGGTIAGKAAVENIAFQKGGTVKSILKEYPDGTLNSNFDDIVEINVNGRITYAVIENKGGSATLGTRLTGTGERAQQGTAEYHYSLLNSMETKLKRMEDDPRRFSDPEFNNAYESISDMYETIKHQPVEFYHVSQTYDSHGNPAQIIVSRYPDIAAKKKS